jgi:VWA domain-containing protein
MSASRDQIPSIRSRPKPAWVISCAVHVGVAVLVLTVLQRTPGGGNNSHGDGGIVLERRSVRDDGRESQGRVTQAVYATTERPVPPALLVADPVAQPTNQAPPSPKSQPSPSGGQKTAGAGQDAGKPAVGGSYGPGNAGKASVHVFGVQGVGTKFVYVFDRSSSMEGPPLSAAKQQLIASINSLEAIHQFQVIFFNHQMRTFDATGGGHRVAFATDRSKQLAANFIGGITADGGTDRLAALRAAVAMQPDVIFFLTDADDPMPENELAEVIQLNQRAAAKICTIQFGEGPEQKTDNFLVQLARRTGGQYGYVDTTRLGK